MAEEDPQERSNWALLQRLQDGDADAFWEIWELHKKRLFGICRKMLEGRSPDAEEALETVMMRIWAALPVSDIGNLEFWLNAVARHTCLEFQRNIRREVTGIESEQLEPPRGTSLNDPMDTTVRGERITELFRNIERLPCKLREAFMLRHIYQMPYDDVANHLQISVGNARQRVLRAVIRLRSFVTDKQSLSQHLWDIRARMVQVRLASVRLPNGATVSCRLHFEERLPYRRVRIDTLRKYVADHPNGASVRLDLANLLGATGKWDEAVEHLRAVLDRRPDQIHLWMRLGEILRGLQHPSEGAGAYRHALDLAKTPAGRLHIRGWIALCDGSVDQALEAFRQATDLEPRNAAHWHAIGFVSRDAFRHTESAEAFDHALDINPKDIVALVGSHDALLHLCQYKKIMDRLSRAVAIDGYDVLALKLLVVHRSWWGYLWGAEGKQTKRWAERAHRLAPETSETVEALAHYHTARGERRLSLQIWESYLRRNNGDVRALRLYASELEAIGHADDAIAVLRKAAELAPSDFFVQVFLCRHLAEYGHAEEASRLVTGLRRRFGESWQCHMKCGYILSTLLGEHDRGCEMARKATDLQPTLSDAHRFYGDVLREAGRLQEAVSAYAQAWELSIPPRHPEHARHIGLVCREMGDEVQAREWFRQAVDSAERTHEWSPTLAYFHCGQALEEFGDAVGAIRAYRSALDIGLMQYEQRKQARQAIKRLTRREYCL